MNKTFYNNKFSRDLERLILQERVDQHGFHEKHVVQCAEYRMLGEVSYGVIGAGRAGQQQKLFKRENQIAADAIE